MKQLGSKVTLRDLYPDITDTQLEVALANVRAYLAVLIRIADRLAVEGKSINDIAEDQALTSTEPVITIQDERSNPAEIINPNK